jgi:integrase
MEVEPIRDLAKIAAMRKALRSNAYGYRDELLFVLGIDTALRIGDLLRLTVGDVFDDKGAIKEEMQVREKKTGKFKVNPINDPVRTSSKIYMDNTNRSGRLFDVADMLFFSRKKNGTI